MDHAEVKGAFVGSDWKSAPVYPTMWQPSYVGGLPVDYAFVVLMVSAVLSALSGSVLFIFLYLFIFYVIGRLLVKIDPEFSTVFLVKYARIKRTKTQDQGGNEYHP